MFRRFGELFIKKWLILRKGTKSHWFCQNLQLFEQPTMFRRFGQLFSKKLKKVAHVVKKQEKSSNRPKLATSRGNYHVSAFLVNFWAKSGPFREKTRKPIDWNLELFDQTTMFWRFGQLFSKKWLIWWKSTKTDRFCQNLELFELTIFRRLGQLFCKKWPISWPFSWTSRKTHRFGQNLQLFERTTIFRCFCQVFRKKLQKVAHFVKKDEKSSIWPKLATFQANYHVSAFWSIFQQNVVKSRSFRVKARKSSFWRKLATFRANYRVWAFWSTFQQKVANFVGHFVKMKHEKASILPKLATFRANYHVSAFWSCF